MGFQLLWLVDVESPRAKNCAFIANDGRGERGPAMRAMCNLSGLPPHGPIQAMYRGPESEVVSI